MSQTFNEIPQWIKDIPPFVSAAVAFVALVVALVHVAIHWRNYRRDRHDVKVELQWNAETVTITGSSMLRYLGRITVTNKGRRPVHIDGVYLELPGRERHINWLDESKRLEEADRPIRIPIAQDSTLEPFVLNNRRRFRTSPPPKRRAMTSL